MRGLLIASIAILAVLIIFAPMIQSYLGLTSRTVTITKPITQTVEKLRMVTVTQRMPITIPSPTTITVTTPIVVTSPEPVIYIQPFTITSTEHVYHTQTRTVTTTTTTTIRIEQIRYITLDQLMTMLDNASRVYAYITYDGGYIVFDDKFVKVVNKLLELHSKGVEVKVLVHPKVCKGLWPYAIPGTVAPKLVEIINRMNKTLGYEHLRVTDAFWAIGPFTMLVPEISLFVNDTKMVVLDFHVGTGAFVVDLPSEVAKKTEEWFENAFKDAQVWNPDKVC